MLTRASVRLLHPFGAVLEEEGVPLEELLAEAGIPRDVYDDPNARVAADGMRGFMVAVARRTRHAALGLEAARHHDQAQFQLLHYLMSSSSSAGAAMADLVRFQALLTDACFMRLESRDGGLLLRCDAAYPRGAYLVVEYIVGGLALALHRSVGARLGAESGQLGSGELLCDAWFSYPEPDSADAYRRFFGTSVCFDAPAIGLMVPAVRLGMKPAQANHRVHEILERQAEEQLRRVAAASSFAERVRLLIVDNLADPNASLSRIAVKLRMSRSTLKRRLAAEGVGYSELVDEARRTAALDYLGHELRLHEIAFLLGYRDISAFHRAFRRWTQLSPTEYRARHGAR